MRRVEGVGAGGIELSRKLTRNQKRTQIANYGKRSARICLFMARTNVWYIYDNLSLSLSLSILFYVANLLTFTRAPLQSLCLRYSLTCRSSAKGWELQIVVRAVAEFNAACGMTTIYATPPRLEKRDGRRWERRTETSRQPAYATHIIRIASQKIGNPTSPSTT